jgi:hypothetical protein
MSARRLKPLDSRRPKRKMLGRNRLDSRRLDTRSPGRRPEELEILLCRKNRPCPPETHSSEKMSRPHSEKIVINGYLFRAIKSLGRLLQPTKAEHPPSYDAPFPEITEMDCTLVGDVLYGGAKTNVLSMTLGSDLKHDFFQRWTEFSKTRGEHDNRVAGFTQQSER